MGFFDALGNALSYAGTRVIETMALASLSDQELLTMFDKLDDYFCEHGQEYENDETYKKNMDLKASIDTLLKGRGYRQKTIYVKTENRIEG